MMPPWPFPGLRCQPCTGTPHQGSSYFSLPSLACSIQSLLQLSSPLPPSVTHHLRVGNSVLTRLDEDFKAASNDLQVWTFYETIDSRLSGGNATAGPDSRDVDFTAPLTSMKSAILGMRQERIFPLQSDHANMASFGRHNVHTLQMFLKQLAHQVCHADTNARAKESSGQWTLGLEQKVNVEVHGFFDDAPPSQGEHQGDDMDCPIVRAWSTRVPLREFLTKGPDECLSERLNEVEGSPEEERVSRHRGRTPLADKASETAPVPPAAPNLMTVQNALGIRDALSSAGLVPSPASPMDSCSAGRAAHSAPAATPRGPKTPPSRAISPKSSPIRRPSPLIRADMEQELAVDRLSAPLRGRMGGRAMSRSFSLGSDGSRFEDRDLAPFSPRSRSSIGDVLASDDEDMESPRLPGAVAAREVVDEAPGAFMKPDVRSRKFVWVHVPFNNPTWVKVSSMLLHSEERSRRSADPFLAECPAVSGSVVQGGLFHIVRTGLLDDETYQGKARAALCTLREAGMLLFCSESL